MKHTDVLEWTEEDWELYLHFRNVGGFNHPAAYDAVNDERQRIAKTPTDAQSSIVEAIANLVDIMLERWGRQSGKTTLRKMLAVRILRDDR